MNNPIPRHQVNQYSEADRLSLADTLPLRATRVMIKVPEVTVFFWMVKLLTTAMGESTSDYLVFQINPYVAVILGCLGLAGALALQLWVRKYIAWVYWLAVVMVAIFGTMAADVIHVVLGVPYEVSTAAFASALAVIFLIWYASERTLSVHTIYRGRRELFYWATVMATFALGTAAGDLAATIAGKLTASTLDMGYFPAIILFAVLFALPGLAYWLFGLNEVAAFWCAYVVTRPLGASVADWLGKPYLGGLGLGDSKVALVLTVLIVLFVGYLSITHRDVQKRQRRRTPSKG